MSPTVAADLVARLSASGRTVAVAESLTGGRGTAALTEVAGAAVVVRGGVLAYATDLKASVLGVDAVLLAQAGAVDADVAEQMASGVRSLMTATYGSRYVFGHIKQQIVSAELRLNWTFTPALSLQAYLQPFIGVGHYNAFKELARPRAYAYNAYGQGASTVDYADGVYTVDRDGAGPASGSARERPTTGCPA